MPMDSVYSNMASLMINEKKGHDGELTARMRYGPWFLWRIWKDRNDLCFTGKHLQADLLVHRALGDAKEWFDQLRKPISTQASAATPQSRWKPPPSGFLKCNVDASWVFGQNLTGSQVQ
ncbi:unnamed protein product [Microthlaspi erraticum]|uniref:Uncharacterized protein n=1 Tax=Microthlaspi erraticum TaxID=1685480 RepID=A0A6D2IST0_9BRAS|nr:unnamed protein product [Microthlaspi erraticum]